MKKNRSLVAQSLATVPILLSFTVSLTPAVYAQSAEVSKTAKEACIKVAKDKGYKKINIVSLTPKGTDGANVVLSLSKEADGGNPAKLTCGWSQKAGAAFGEDKVAPVAATTPAPVTTTAPVVTKERGGFPWWLLLLPLLGLGAYFLLRKKPAVEETIARPIVYDSIEPYEGIIQNNGSAVDVYSQPNSSSMVMGTLNDGQRVRLSGSQDNNWSQLSDGGWIPTRYVKKQVM